MHQQITAEIMKTKVERLLQVEGNSEKHFGANGADQLTPRGRRSLHLSARCTSCSGGRPPPGTAAVHSGTR